jgi:hypothetical protein
VTYALLNADDRRRRHALEPQLLARPPENVVEWRGKDGGDVAVGPLAARERRHAVAGARSEAVYGRRLRISCRRDACGDGPRRRLGSQDPGQ